MTQIIRSLALAASTVFPGFCATPGYFVPAHQLPGIGVGRQELTQEMLALRTEAMIQSQTFSIMREPMAVAGASRISNAGLEHLFREAEHKSGFPAETLQAMAYLESWGVANAVSPAGPRGILQISEATGRRMGLRIVYATHRRTVKTKVAARNKHGKLVYRTERHKESYTVLVRDDRLRPDKAIPAAAKYLAGLEQRYGVRDWAIWAYHCGEGCVADFRAMTKATPGLDDPAASVARVFFGCSPVWNRELCGALHAQMERDYSPTYWFRVMRAEQLLRMYREDVGEFRDLAIEYKYSVVPTLRAPDRLSAWLKPQDVIYQNGDVIRNDARGRLVTAPEDPEFLGYQFKRTGWGEGEWWRAQALPSTIGALIYVSYETRRLYAALCPGANFVPLEATALVLPKTAGGMFDGVQGGRMLDHATGQVFDVAMNTLPSDELKCLQFVLDDLGWNGALGFIEEPPAMRTLHIGCSPSSRAFFAGIFAEAEEAWRDRALPAPVPGLLPSPLDAAGPQVAN